MIDSIGPKKFDESNVFETIAFGLATLEKHGDRNREVERLIQQISLVHKQTEGPLGELLWATENFLASTQTGSLSDQEGARQVLQDLAQFLHTASSKKDTSSIEIDEIDELLERLDFLASGGTDREIPRNDRSTSTPPREFTKIKFPIERSSLIEDPLLTRVLELGKSTCHLLSSNLRARNDRRSQYLMERHLQQLSTVEDRISDQSFIGLSDLIGQLTDSINPDSEVRSDAARIEIDIDSNCSDRIYRSLANVLVPVTKTLMKALMATTVNRSEASFEFHTVATSDGLAFSFLLKGIKNKLVERMESTLRSLVSAEFSRNGAQGNSLEQDTTSYKMIQSALITFAEVVQSIAGTFVVESQEPGKVEISATVNKNTRITKVLPATIDSNRYGIEAYFVQAVVPARTEMCDIYRNLVFHEKDSYEYRKVDLTRNLDQIDSNDSGLFVLMDCNSRKLAVHVDQIHDIENLALCPSSSSVEFGNTLSVPSSNMLQLDLQSDFSTGAFKTPTKSQGPIARNCLYLCDTSSSLVDRFHIATRSMDIECEAVYGIFETIRAIQERTPRILVLQDSDNGRNCLDQVRLSRRYFDLRNTQILVATTDDESQQSRFGSEFSELKWISMDIQVSELVDLLASNLGSEGQ